MRRRSTIGSKLASRRSHVRFKTAPNLLQCRHRQPEMRITLSGVRQPGIPNPSGVRGAKKQGFCALNNYSGESFGAN